jgi:flavodoxin
MNNENGKILIAYFSHSGNTRTIAGEIQKITGGALFEISTVTPYPKDYNTVVNIARREQDQNNRPRLAVELDGMQAYEVVFLGYPNWWSTMPMAVFTFLESYNFSGKTILPFCTHEGSRMGHSESDIARLCPRATVSGGLAVTGASVKNARDDVTRWIEKAGIKG